MILFLSSQQDLLEALPSGPTGYLKAYCVPRTARLSSVARKPTADWSTWALLSSLSLCNPRGSTWLMLTPTVTAAWAALTQPLWVKQLCPCSSQGCLRTLSRLLCCYGQCCSLIFNAAYSVLGSENGRLSHPRPLPIMKFITDQEKTQINQ